MNMHRPSCVVVTCLIVTQILGPAVLWAADQRGIRVEANRRVLISAISGEQLTTQNGADSKALHFRDVVSAGDQVTTGDRTVADVLIGNRAVVTLGQSTTVQFAAVSEEQTTVQVKKGIVRVAASALALGEQGKVTVQTPTGQVQTRGGIIRVMVDAPVGSAEYAPIGEARPYLASYSPSTIVAAVTTRGEIIQVEEGTAEIAGAGPGGGALMVKSGQAVTLQSGQAGSVSGLVSQGAMRTGVVASAGHSSIPKEGLDNLVALQIDQATALGKALTGAAETGEGDSGKKDESKNAINGATGGVTLANILLFPPTPQTQGTMVYNNSNFSVTTPLMQVESAFSGAFRDGNGNLQPCTPCTGNGLTDDKSISPPSSRLIITNFNGATNQTLGSSGSEVLSNPALASQFKNPFSSGADQAADLASINPQHSLQGRVHNEDVAPIINFADGVKLIKSTATSSATINNQLLIDLSPAQDNTPTIAFQKNGLVLENSTVAKATGDDGFLSLFSAQGPISGMNVAASSKDYSLVQLIDSASTSTTAVLLDTAILTASAPIINLYGSQNGPGSSMAIEQEVFRVGPNAPAKIAVNDALVFLTASKLISGGALVTLANGSSLTASALAILQNGSLLQVGASSLVSFIGTGNTLELTGVACTGTCQTKMFGTNVLVLFNNISAGAAAATNFGNTIAIPASYNAYANQAGNMLIGAGKPLLVLNGSNNTVKLGP